MLKNGLTLWFSICIQDDQHFALTIQIMAATNPEMNNAATLRELVSCSYSQWQPREIVCEANYMEVSWEGDNPAATLNIKGKYMVQNDAE